MPPSLVRTCASCDGTGKFTSRPPNQFTYNCGTCHGTGLDRATVLAELRRRGWNVNMKEGRS